MINKKSRGKLLSEKNSSIHHWHWIKIFIFPRTCSLAILIHQIYSLSSLIQQTIQIFSFFRKEQRNFYKRKSNKMINNARKIENNSNKRLQQYPTIQNPFSLLEQCNEGILNGSHVKWIWIRVWQTLFTNDLRLYQDQIKKKASIREWIRKTICFLRLSHRHSI